MATALQAAVPRPHSAGEQFLLKDQEANNPDVRRAEDGDMSVPWFTLLGLTILTFNSGMDTPAPLDQEQKKSRSSIDRAMQRAVLLLLLLAAASCVNVTVVGTGERAPWPVALAAFCAWVAASTAVAVRLPHRRAQ